MATTPETVLLECSECGREFATLPGVALINHIGPSSASARASGLGGYCSRCNLAFCGVHAVWKGLPGLVYDPYCPVCGAALHGPPSRKPAPALETDSQTISLPDVYRLLFADLPPAVLCGAGISAAPPSNLPVARRLLEEYDSRLRSCLAASPAYQNCLPPLKEWIPKMRLEEVLSLFRMVGYTTEPVEPLNSGHRVNRNHESVARLHASGCPILTTNFDILLELAILEREGSVRQLISRDDFKEDQQDLGSVAKLHGSFWRWDGSSWQNSRDSMVGSIESIGGQFVQYSYNSPQKLFLNQLLSSRPLLVLGYSGTDDFDISPLVLRSTNQRLIVWVQHDATVDTTIVATRLAQVPAALRDSVPPRLFGRVSGGEPNVVYLRGNTQAILESIADTRGTSFGSSTRHLSPPIPPASPAELSSLFLTTPWHALTVAGWLQERLTHFDLARSAFNFAHNSAPLTSEDSRAWWVTATLAGFELHHGDKKRGQSLAEKGLAATRKNNKTAAASFLRLLGSALAESDVSSAIKLFREAAESAAEAENAYSEGTSRRLLGRSLWISGQRDEALDCLDTSFRLLESIGCIEEMANSLYGLGVLEYEGRRFDTARNLFTESRRLAVLLGDDDHVALVEHELGLVAARTGFLGPARKHFEEALRFARATGQRSREATALKEMAVLEMRHGDLLEADRLEHESTKILENIGNRYFLGHNIQLRAMILFRQGRIQQGCQCIQEAIAISRQVGDMINVSNCTAILSRVTEAALQEGFPIQI